MATVTEVVKETLVGTTVEPELSQEIRAAFNRSARQDEATGEDYMDEEEFVNAIAPANEDYVSSQATLYPPALFYSKLKFGDVRLTVFGDFSIK